MAQEDDDAPLSPVSGAEDDIRHKVWLSAPAEVMKGETFLSPKDNPHTVSDAMLGVLQSRGVVERSEEVVPRA